MPAEGVALSARAALLARAELRRLVRVFAALGVTKLRLTGGEPTLRKDLVDIVQELSDTPGIRAVAMTTNGVALTRRLPALQRAGLSALNVSLDSLRADRYERMARRPGLSRALASVDLALQLGYSPVKINTVLMKGFNDDEICDFVELTRDRDVEVRFIEFMPFSGNRWGAERMVAGGAALAAVRAAHPALQRAAPRASDTATVWRVPGYAGSVGFISSMTQPFCSSCNRLRLTADGNLKVCLFGAAEVSLRDALRAGAGDEDLRALVRAALRRKHRQHAARAAAPRAAPPATLHRPDPPPRAAPPAPRHRPAPLHRRAPLAARAYCTRPPAPDGGTSDGAEPVRRNRRPAGGSEAAEADADAGAFTHLDGEGRARMVDVGAKAVTARAAEAECFLRVSPRLLRLLRSARLPKGDALTVAQVAGALAAKRTADLIPLCHPLPLELARVRVTLPREDARDPLVRVHCEARATARTGVEMEALTGCAVAALALYDMCKSVDKRMCITGLRVVRKAGGSADWPRGEGEAPAVRAHDTSPLRPGETFAPTNFAYF
ncbi:molybdenum cofactor biosynthesis protein 1 isoform X2 [Epargyreus clarus]